MLEAIEQFIAKNNLCTKNDRILVAVSGGIDSVVLLDLFSRAGYSPGIAHCNFKLRSAESDEDEAFVRKLAEKYDAKIHVKTCDASKYANQHKYSIQEAARVLRYQWFDDVCTANCYDKVAVGQHVDDHIETFFINLLRGSGVAGLKGIPVQRGNIIRPLLFAARTEIERFAKERKLDYREDSSNLSNKYLRNQIRHQMLSHLEKIKGDYRTSIVNSLQFLADDHQLVEQFINQIRGDLFVEEGGLTKIKKEQLLKLNKTQTLLFYLLKDYGFNRDVTDSICKSLQKRQTGKMFHAPFYELLIDRELLILKKIEPKDQDEISIIESPGKILTSPISITSEIVDDIDSFKFKKDPSCGYFDLDKISFPLSVMKWKPGDRFIPFGMKGSKLVSDLLIDLKVDRFEKENVYVIKSDEKIIWLIGYRTSDEFKITEQTKAIVVLKKA